MKRIILFLATNLAIVVVLSVVAHLIGLDGYLAARGGSLGGLLAFAALFGFAGSLISLGLSKWMSRSTMGVQVISQPRNATESWLLDTVAAHARNAGIGMPEVGVFDSPEPNAFATGRNPRHSSVAVTQGLLEFMNDDELEGVIAHELSHVRNYDILTSSIAATLAGAITMIASMGRWAMIFGGWGSRDDNRDGGGLAALLMIILAPLAALLLQLGISRQREYQADASGARMVGHPYGLMKALEKLGAYNKRIPMDIPPSTSALCIVAPLTPGQLVASLFSTHPPLGERIEALRNMQITR
jgi:heat shock protein HtpX